MSRLLAVRAGSAVLGVLVVVASLAVAHGQQRHADAHPANFGTSRVAEAAPASAPSGSLPREIRSWAGISRPPTSASSSSHAATGVRGEPRSHAPAEPPAGAPVRLELPRVKVSADVVPVFSTAHSVQVPDDPAVLGWWLASAPAGARTGTTVVVGHVDSATRGLGALFALGRQGLQPGDVVRVTTDAGSIVSYRVYGQHVYDKRTGIPRAVFTSSGAPRLVLITCGGPFDVATGSYDDNVVAFAAPSLSASR